MLNINRNVEIVKCMTDTAAIQEILEARHKWHTPIVPATLETERGGSL